MKQVFADAFYWIASINPGDDWYNRTRAVTATLNQVQIVTIDEVLTEVLTFTHLTVHKCGDARLNWSPL